MICIRRIRRTLRLSSDRRGICVYDIVKKEKRKRYFRERERERRRISLLIIYRTKAIKLSGARTAHSRGASENTIILMSKEREFCKSILRGGSEDSGLLASVEDFGSYADEWRYDAARLHIHFAFHIEHDGAARRGRTTVSIRRVPEGLAWIDGCLTSNGPAGRRG